MVSQYHGLICSLILRGHCSLLFIVISSLVNHLSMPRRETRLGIVYIENDQERQTTFSKRRSGLYKRASDLYALTGARVVVTLEKDNGKMYSFGTPSADPIIDAFLSEGPPIEPFIDEVTNARIASLQREVDRLETNNAREEKREKLSLQNIKEIKDENPGMIANYIFSKEEDLSLEDLKSLFNELMRIKVDITDRAALYVPDNIQSALYDMSLTLLVRCCVPSQTLVRLSVQAGS
ncbi:agamous-like MADS-box protein AGL29 [Lolium rigidum]|uniref:agamous-like MADS-box protein AGL29 n=1 Tax=Lolium rigidum TaxID=89674 RepID=UPI001F5E0425|nr:agamous-like MADS-box protein AGL29 [Lolium rigidum]